MDNHFKAYSTVSTSVGELAFKRLVIGFAQILPWWAKNRSKWNWCLVDKKVDIISEQKWFISWKMYSFIRFLWVEPLLNFWNDDLSAPGLKCTLKRNSFSQSISNCLASGCQMCEQLQDELGSHQCLYHLLLKAEPLEMEMGLKKRAIESLHSCPSLRLKG